MRQQIWIKQAVMNNKPLVSGIIIFLNGEAFIQEAIESVFAQNYDNWELLLVDDGSTDASTAIALDYAQKYPEKVRYLEHENHQNQGMSASRNLGLQHAKGEYIGFLDADDIWLPEKLEQQVAILKSHPEAAMIYGRTQIWYSWTGNPEDSKLDHFYDLGVQPSTLVEPPTLLTLYIKGGVQTPTTCNALMRRQVFDEIGRFENTFRGTYEDQIFFAKLCLNASVFVADECWARYRQHPDSCFTQAQKTGEADSAWIPYLEWIANYATQQGVKDTQFWKVLRKSLFPYHHPSLYRFLNIIQQFLEKIRWKLILIARRILPNSVYNWLQQQGKAEMGDAT